jgi:Fic family protein
MNSLKSSYLENLRFTTEETTVLKRLGEHRGRQTLYSKQKPEILETLRQVAIVQSIESSNRLEGITAPPKRIENIIAEKTTPRNRSEQEIAGYRDALNLIHDSWLHMQFTENVILQLHSLIYRYHSTEGGHWKMNDNQIIERFPDGTVKVRFEPVSAVRTPSAMHTLVGQYLNLSITEAYEELILIPITVFDFLCIHPFSDGNGRVSRLLTSLLLYKFGYDVGRYISLERIFEESKESYYEVLEESSRGWHEGKHNIYPWLDYFWGVMLRAYKEFEERIEAIPDSGATKTEQIKDAVKRKVGPFAISDIESACPGISRDMIRNVLRQLRDEDIIESTGIGRAAKWILKRNN